MHPSLAKGFTLVELMIVIAILGILVTALFPAYANYIQRGRDVTRISHIDFLSKSNNLYLADKSDYPISTLWCVNESALAQYNIWTNSTDPIASKSNGCNTLGKYGYAMSTGLLSSPDEFSLVAIMEQPFGWNYSGSLVGFTGNLTQQAFSTGTSNTYIIKGSGPNYVRIP